MHIFPRRGRLLATSLAAAVVACLSFSAVAPASVNYVSPRKGHFCGFESTIDYPHSRLVPSNPNHYLNQCQHLMDRAFIEEFHNSGREPISFYIALNNSHYYMTNFRWGYDYVQYIRQGDLGQSAVPSNASDNGKSVEGGFLTSGFYKGVLNHGSYKRHIYAWWVGHHCALFTGYYNWGCISQ